MPYNGDIITKTRKTEAEKLTFFSAVSERLQSHKLGDLLVHSRLISTEQLEKALAAQKESAEQLGEILVRQGAISAVQLYRKLAEQWCLKMSAAGLTVMMGVMSFSPSSARAASGQGEIVLASATMPGATTHKKIKYPALFGAKEIKSSNLSKMSQWTGMLDRFEAQLRTQGANASVQKWRSKLNQMRSGTILQKAQSVNDDINKNVRYIEDKDNYAKSDYWATPIEFLRRGGDCEDFAIAKYASLRALGVPTENMRVALVEDKIKRIAHAVLIVYTEKGAYVLDNQDKRMRRMEDVTRYKVLGSFNRDNVWLHFYKTA